MEERFDLLIKGGMAATPGGLALLDIGVRDGRIAALGALGAAQAAEELRRARTASAAGRDRHAGPYARAGHGA